MSQATPAGAPTWRHMAGLAAVVALVHALLLGASPLQMGTRADPNTAGSTAFATRSIEPAPAAQTIAQASQSAPQPAPQPVRAKARPQPPKKPLNEPVGQSIRAQAAPDSIAPELPAAVAESSIPATTQAASTSTQTVVADSLPAVATAAAATVATAAAPPVGPEATPVMAFSLPGSVRLQYKVVGLAKNLNYEAKSELAWKTNGDSYEVMMKVSAFLVGSRSMTSVGKITGAGLAPIRFADQFRSELAAHFEADKGKITFSANTPDAPWIEGAQDRVSVFVQLGGILAARPQDYPKGSTITLYTIGPREADTWTFVVESEEKLNLLGGEMASLKVIRKPRREFDQKVEIWYAPSLGYLPVRNRITQENGDFIDQQLTEVSKP